MTPSAFHQPQRQSSYNQSPYVEDIDLSTLPDVEVVANAPEWVYVERLLSKPKTVPEPTEKAEYPSGWQPQTIDPTKAPYMIHRNKNHMIPVYLHTGERNQRQITMVKRIQGDIHALAEDLLIFLEDYTGRKVPMRINEYTGIIFIKRDYVNLIKDYLMKKGY